MMEREAAERGRGETEPGETIRIARGASSQRRKRDLSILDLRLPASAGSVRFDARRAIWLAETGTLAIADVHFGYPWAHRHAGQLLPVSAAVEDAPARIIALLDCYRPRELVLLGDIVHLAVPVEALKTGLRSLVRELEERVPQVTWVAGNHDRQLQRLLEAMGLGVKLVREATVGPHLFVHGDEPDPEWAAAQVRAVAARGGCIFIGHEHPAITISDRVATCAKCPCFVVGERVMILPAFSQWAAGANVRARRFLSPFAAGEDFSTAFAVLAGKILPVRL